MPYPEFTIRGADENDTAFLERIFVVAADWNPETAHGEDYWRADPMLTKYIGGWKRDDDYGYVVESHGEPEPQRRGWQSRHPVI